MSASRFAAAALAVLLLAAAAAAAGSCDAFAPLNGTAAGEVPPGGRAAGVGVIVSAGTTKGSLQVKAARGSLLAPRVALVHPDGTVLDQDFLVLAGRRSGRRRSRSPSPPSPSSPRRGSTRSS